MIFEFFKHLSTPAPKHIKKLGFVAEAIAIEARYKRCKGNWQPHLDNCKTIILEKVKALKPKANIVVMGAGSLNDLPIKRLVEQGFKLTLVDIIFLNNIKKEATKHEGVSLVEKDITNYSKIFYNSMAKGFDDIPTIPEPLGMASITDEPVDLIISLNILSQLPIMFEELLGKKQPKYNFDDMTQQLMQKHINWLNGEPCAKLLIADIKRSVFNGETIEAEEKLPIVDNLGEPIKSWDWDIAPKGEAKNNKSLKHKVGAWDLGV